MAPRSFAPLFYCQRNAAVIRRALRVGLCKEIIYIAALAAFGSLEYPQGEQCGALRGSVLRSKNATSEIE